ncbi:MAG: nucleotidyltransferase family protein [Oscillospiraceae bacterium]|jgi:molybdenum cofactor cytidylyltransferase|nr:nucleotidyltransferase family protein [Oscillospiraceae bacterium]
MQLNISAILTAAGLSKRMGCDKLLLEFNGVTLLQRAVDLLSELSVSEKILITIEERLERLVVPQGIQIIINENPETGHSSSVRLGIETANKFRHISHYLFLVADQPKLTKADIQQIIDAGEINQDKIIYPVINDKPNTPSLFPIKFSDELLKISGDTGGRVIRDLYLKSCLAIPPINPDRFTDINTMEDYNALNDC